MLLVMKAQTLIIRDVQNYQIEKLIGRVRDCSVRVLGLANSWLYLTNTAKLHVLKEK